MTASCLKSGGNKIKFINSRLFQGLLKLNYLSLYENECTNSNWTKAVGGEKLQSFLHNITESCSFQEAIETPKKFEIIIPESDQKPLTCECCKQTHKHWCVMKDATTITRDDTAIATLQDLEIVVLYFGFNHEIYFLPVSVNETFPNLKNLEARYCSLRFISKKNFEGLFKLEYLDLEENFIEKIESDTFDGLDNLKYVNLGRLMISEDHTQIQWTKCFKVDPNLPILLENILGGLNEL